MGRRLEWEDQWRFALLRVWVGRCGVRYGSIHGWTMEEELAKMQIDAVITEVAIDESANPGCDEDGVLVDGY